MAKVFWTEMKPPRVLSSKARRAASLGI